MCKQCVRLEQVQKFIEFHNKVVYEYLLFLKCLLIISTSYFQTRYKQSSSSSSGAGSGLSGSSASGGARRDRDRDRERDHYGKQHSFELPRQHSKEEAYHRDRDRDRDRESSTGLPEKGGVGVTGSSVYVDRRTRPRSITNRRGAIKHQKSVIRINIILVRYNIISHPFQNPRHQWTSFCGQILSPAYFLCFLQLVPLGIW